MCENMLNLGGGGATMMLHSLGEGGAPHNSRVVTYTRTNLVLLKAKKLQSDRNNLIMYHSYFPSWGRGLNVAYSKKI